jgi:LppP/LprE lipoprotein
VARRIFAVMATAACVSFIASPNAGAEPPTCEPDPSTALQTALAQLPSEPLTGRGWDDTPVGSNYDPCADLSTILVMIEGGTGSSPVQALMFHRGQYLGTGTSKAYGFTSLNAARSADDMVVVDYKTPGAFNACPHAGVTSVRYQWQDDGIEMLDPAPPG